MKNPSVRPIVLLGTAMLSVFLTGFLGLAQVARGDNHDEGRADEPLSFAFIQTPPGQLVSLGSHRLHLNCHGEGAITVWLEAGLGGNALEWGPVMEGVAPFARVCSYDRAGYAWSDPSLPAHDAEHLALEADQLLRAAGISGPLVVVGHSFGGFIVRLLAMRRPDDVVGMVLLDSSHEGQFERFEGNGGKAIMPTSRQFVISANSPPENLPERIRRKVEAFARMRKTYAATHDEMANFRRSAMQVAAVRAKATEPMSIPLVVIRRGRNVYGREAEGLEKSSWWQGLQEDLVKLSTQGHMVVATNSGHHIHADEPRLVIDQIKQVVHRVANR